MVRWLTSSLPCASTCVHRADAICASGCRKRRQIDQSRDSLGVCKWIRKRFTPEVPSSTSYLHCIESSSSDGGNPSAAGDVGFNLLDVPNNLFPSHTQDMSTRLSRNFDRHSIRMTIHSVDGPRCAITCMTQIFHA